MNLNVNKWNSSTLEVKLEVDKNDLEKYEKKFLENAKKDIEVPGFMKGKAPIGIVKNYINPEGWQDSSP